VAFRETSHEAAIAMNARMAGAIASAVSAAGYAVHRMVSGAGHDAMILAAAVPSGMLFIRTPKGLSHHPEEAVSEADVGAACAVYLRLLDGLDPGLWRSKD
jgi:allantoate deiminase